MKLCLEELVEEGGEDTMPCELDVDDLTSPIDAGIGRLATRLVGCLRAWLEVMDEATREGPREDRLLSIEEDTCSLLDQEIDDLGA